MMDFKGPLLITVVFFSYGICGTLGDAPAKDSAQTNSKPSDKGQKLELVAAEVKNVAKEEGVWMKHNMHVLKVDAGSQDTEASSTVSSTPSVPTSTPAPVHDEKGDWMLNYTQSSSVCARLVAEIKLKVSYSNAKNETGESEITVPKKAVVSGNCSTGEMVLSWGPGNPTKKNETIQFNFSLDNATRIWKMANVTGVVKLPLHFPSNTNKTQSLIFSFYNNSTTSTFNGRIGMSYMCLKSNSYDLSHENHSGINVSSGTMTFSQLQVEAYKPESANNSVFGSANNCELTPDMVPIAVGCALAGLVVIVLVAYLVAHGRTPSQGYRSV